MNRQHTKTGGRHKRQVFALPPYPDPFALYSKEQHRLDSYTHVYLFVPFSCISASVHTPAYWRPLHFLCRLSIHSGGSTLCLCIAEMVSRYCWH